jgi:hypothetical protein
MVNGVTNTALTAALNALNQTGPYEQFLTIGISPSVLLPGDVLTLSIDEGGTGGDGWAIDFLTIGITTSPAPGILRVVLGPGGNTINITVFVNLIGEVIDTTTSLSPPVVWTPAWTNNAGVTNISFPILYQQQFFRLRPRGPGLALP